MTRVVMLLFQPYSPDPRVRQEAISLSKAGFQVSLIAWNRNGTSNLIKEKKFDIYHIGPKLPPNFSSQPIILQATLKVSVMLLFSIRAFFLAIRLKADIIHAHDLDTLHIGFFSSKILETHLVYDSHELYSQMLSRHISQWLANKVDRLEAYLIKHVTLIITVTEFHKKHFENKGATNILVVTNSKELTSPEYIPPNNSNLILIYIGILNESRFLLEGINVCGAVEGVHFKIAGYGPLANRIGEASKEKKYKNIEFLGRIPSEKVIPEIQKADVVFCILDPSNINNRVGPPNKLFEAMVAGRPVIAAKGTYSGKLTMEMKMGIAIDFTKEAFKQALIKLRDEPKRREEYGRNALNAALTKYNWDIEEKKLIRGYNGLITTPYSL